MVVVVVVVVAMLKLSGTRKSSQNVYPSFNRVNSSITDYAADAVATNHCSISYGYVNNRKTISFVLFSLKIPSSKCAVAPK